MSSVIQRILKNTQTQTFVRYISKRDGIHKVMPNQLRCCSTSRRYIPRRAAMYIPGNDEKKLRKIPGFNVDCAIMDCEDGVALNRKVSISQDLV